MPRTRNSGAKIAKAENKTDTAFYMPKYNVYEYLIYRLPQNVAVLKLYKVNLVILLDQSDHKKLFTV